MELDAMVGAVGRIGRCVNVPTPMCDLLYAILLPYKNRPPGSRDLLATRFIGGLAIVEYGVDAVVSK